MPAKRPDYIRKTEDRKTRRSLNAPLWAIGIALVGYPLLRDATADRMQRNTYRNIASCECAYSRAQCSTNSSGQWVGPWYAADPAERKPDDPGEGKWCNSGGRGFHGSYGGYGSNSSNSGNTSSGSNIASQDTTPMSGIERGYRGGFGSSGRVRAAGS